MQNRTMQDYQASSYLEGENLAYIEGLFEDYCQDPESVSDDWRQFFDSMSQGEQPVSFDAIRQYFQELAYQKPRATGPSSASETAEYNPKEIAVAQLIEAYRRFGHSYAKLDPLGLAKKHEMPPLELDYYGLNSNDLRQRFASGSQIGMPNATLQEIVDFLKQVYCQSLGVEYTHITNAQELEWLKHQIESVGQQSFSNDSKQHILHKLCAAEGLEKFLGMKYVGQKRFSLEGGDSLIPMLSLLLETSSELDVTETVIGMAHRGRLNVLINVLGKAPKELFAEFEGQLVEKLGTGDVKYHKGFSSDVVLSNNQAMHLALAFNPSHLEIVAPVVEGSVRARQKRQADDDCDHIMPIVIHGDAAIAGQGVVMETLNFSQARGFCTGGSVHIVINNQIGFTTSHPRDARSTQHCTDIAKMVEAPVFHVNSDDPEAVAFVANLAARYRAQFKKDIFIDLVCYRRQGHNEADDPAITQPKMYEIIRQLPSARQLYAQKLIDDGVLTEQQAEQTYQDYMDQLGDGEQVVETASAEKAKTNHVYADWEKHIGKSLDESVDTGYPLEQLRELAHRHNRMPEHLNLHKQVKRLVKEREAMANGEQLVNWGFAENLAYATLLENGYPVRLCGQDSGRGTFAHRHAKIHDVETGEVYAPLSNLSDQQARFIAIDSLLSEEAVVAFEYGFATSYPNSLVLWEAQFGDFVNNAQVVIDQFISSGEQKWGRLCGLVMLLPHGYEGMGPEHSSARLERFLQLCAQQNMQVCIPSTPSQVFHMLRRQMLRPARKPLIVMSPKSLLRHKSAVSELKDLAQGSFQEVIDEVEDPIVPKQVKRVIVCSGKVYYDLLAQRQSHDFDDVAIVRLEQQYPFPRQQLSEVLQRYHNAQDVIWCQEEPKNQGAWYQIRHHIRACLTDKQQLQYTGRRPLAAPAVGSAQDHKTEQQALVNEALGINHQ